jgi:hypothetical protein
MTKYFVTSNIAAGINIQSATASKKNLQFIETGEIEVDGTPMIIGVSSIGYNKEGRKNRSTNHEYVYYYYLIVQELAITCTSKRFDCQNYTQERSVELALEYFVGSFPAELKRINLEALIDKVGDYFGQV